MDVTDIKKSIAIITIIVAQAFAIIWYVAQLDSTVSGIEENVVAMQETLADTGVDVEEVRTTQAVITNEMRSIMADHNGFADTLKEMGQSSALPSGERRTYGGY